MVFCGATSTTKVASMTLPGGFLKMILSAKGLIIPR